jgi:hypothetical protein
MQVKNKSIQIKDMQMSSNWVLNDLQANYKLIVRIPMDSIENLYFIRIHYMIIYISFVNIIVCLLCCLWKWSVKCLGRSLVFRTPFC